jgi:hypothetical protein
MMFRGECLPTPCCSGACRAPGADTFPLRAVQLQLINTLVAWKDLPTAAAEADLVQLRQDMDKQRRAEGDEGELDPELVEAVKKVHSSPFTAAAAAAAAICQTRAHAVKQHLQRGGYALVVHLVASYGFCGGRNHICSRTLSCELIHVPAALHKPPSWGRQLYVAVVALH